MSDAPWQLYGVRHWGSAIAEAMLTEAGQAYAFIDVAGCDRPGPARDRLLAVNPLAQVPTLVLPDGTVLTETAAIALLLADRAPGLAPPPGAPDRARFLRLLVWLVANVYPTFTYGDYPERWVSADPAALKASTDRYREDLYRWLEQQVVGPFVLGEQWSALDLYLAVMLSWGPREAWFRAHTPKIATAGLRARARPSLREVMRQNGLATIE